MAVTGATEKQLTGIPVDNQKATPNPVLPNAVGEGDKAKETSAKPVVVGKTGFADAAASKGMPALTVPDDVKGTNWKINDFLNSKSDAELARLSVEDRVAMVRTGLDAWRIRQGDYFSFALGNGSWTKVTEAWTFEKLLTTAPKEQHDALVRALVDESTANGKHSLLRQLNERVERQEIRTNVLSALGPAIARQLIERDDETAFKALADGVEGGTKNTDKLTPQVRINFAAEQASRQIVGDTFGVNKYAGLAVREDASGGQSKFEAFLVPEQGNLVSLGKIDKAAEKAQDPVALAKELRQRFQAFQATGDASRPGSFPKAWAALANQWVPEGQSVSGATIAQWYKTDESGNDGRFEIPVNATLRAALGGAKTDWGLQSDIQIALKKLGVAQPKARVEDPNLLADPVLIIPEHEAELLLKNRAFDKAFREDGKNVFSIPAGWNLVREIDGHAQFVLPTELYRQFSWMDPDIKNPVEALQSGLAKLGHQFAPVEREIDGKKAIAIPTAYAEQLHGASVFKFLPDVQGINYRNEYWLNRFANEAYSDGKKLDEAMRKMGIPKGNYSMINIPKSSDGKDIDAQCLLAVAPDPNRPGKGLFYLIPRGTDSLTDAFTDGNALDLREAFVEALNASNGDFGEFRRLLGERMKSIFREVEWKGHTYEVPEGFFDYVNTLYPEIVKQLPQLAKNAGFKVEDLRVVGGGHSLGGAAGKALTSVFASGDPEVGRGPMEVARASFHNGARSVDDAAAFQVGMKQYADGSRVGERSANVNAAMDVVNHLPDGTLLPFRNFGYTMTLENRTGQPLGAVGFKSAQKQFGEWFSAMRAALPSGSKWDIVKFASLMKRLKEGNTILQRWQQGNTVLQSHLIDTTGAILASKIGGHALPPVGTPIVERHDRDATN